jgi:hypothetical protein
MYALASIPLIKRLHCQIGDVSQVWYADDASAAGRIARLREWWRQLIHMTLNLGIFPMPLKLG